MRGFKEFDNRSFCRLKWEISLRKKQKN